MSAEDILYGRQGGRRLPKGVTPGSGLGEVAIPTREHRWHPEDAPHPAHVAPRPTEAKCPSCGRLLGHKDSYRCPWTSCRAWLRGTED